MNCTVLHFKGGYPLIIDIIKREPGFSFHLNYLSNILP